MRPPPPASLGREANRHLIYSCSLQTTVEAAGFSAGPPPAQFPQELFFPCPRSCSLNLYLVEQHPFSLCWVPTPFSPGNHFSPILSPCDKGMELTLPLASSDSTRHFLAQGRTGDPSQVNETQLGTSVGLAAKRSSSSAEAAEPGAVGATPWEATVSEVH